jgi:hypothetical protein
MSEGFEVKEPYVAGYGVLTLHVAEQFTAISRYVQDNASARDGFDGLMSTVREPVNGYASKTASRLTSIGSLLYNTSEELTRTAWVYTGTERANYEVFSDTSHEKPNQKPQVVGYKDFPNPVAFPIPALVRDDLKPVDIAPADIKKHVDEVGGALQGINDAVAALTGWYPVDAIVEPMSGNWNALKGAGEALTNAGNAVDEALSNLTGSLGQLDANWNGAAAQSFMDYIGKLVAGAGEEAPLNRIVGGVYNVLAKEIEHVAGWIVQKLKQAVDTVAQAAATSWVPFYGWAKVADAVHDAIKIIDEAKNIIHDIENVMNTVRSILDIAQDPVGALQDAGQAKLEQKLAPIKEKIDQYQGGAEVAADLGRLANGKAWSEMPDEEYASGDNPRRAGA